MRRNIPKGSKRSGGELPQARGMPGNITSGQKGGNGSHTLILANMPLTR